MTPPLYVGLLSKTPTSVQHGTGVTQHTAAN